ncbi:hypothetical protein A0H81_08711 [Grifola frondosa]|uniref:YTH domain-containing protein n=1 Tax=Grifola frondosa TaxID=5627 RepID=A0A1C7M471_GRIFR|nr:hypothetical protein A0H81_08711 [Grifola frondosa]
MRTLFLTAAPLRDLTPKPDSQLKDPNLALSAASLAHDTGAIIIGSASTVREHSGNPSTPSRSQSPSSLPPATLYELYPPEPLYDKSDSVFQNPPEDFTELLNFDDKHIYMSADANRTPGSNMQDSQSSSSTSDLGRPSGSRGRVLSVTPYPLYLPPPVARAQESFSTPSAPSPYQQYPPYRQRGGFAGPYTISPQHPVVHQSPPPFAYQPHPGLHASDPSLLSSQSQLVGYPLDTLVPIMQAHPHIYHYPGHSPEGSSSSSHSFPNSPSTMYAHSPVHPSSPPHSPLAPQGAGPPHPQSMPPPHPASYVGQPPYPTPFPYPPPICSVTTHISVSVPDLSLCAWVRTPSPPSRMARALGGTFLLVHTVRPASTSPSKILRTADHVFGDSSPLDAPPVRPASVGTSRNPTDTAPSSPETSSIGPAAERPAQRRPYHPNPPAHRSEWVMWAGNVPSDTTHDELWRFFNSTPSPGSSSTVDSVYGGVSSIFLISRSNCAFVNFQSEEHLLSAIRRFNGVHIRPADPRCPRLVCRVRAREDDLKAGVGGQRGAGMHVKWVRDKRERERELRKQSTSSSEPVMTPSSSPTELAPKMGSLSLSSDDEGGGRHRQPAPHSSSSGSYASTNSSVLMANFPKRYFILKSLTQFDLDLSVEKGLWATQRHNEGILDQAFRTSKEVYLIFGVNKSGEFYGYARMAGPVLHGEHRVSWASRTESPPHRRSSQQSPSQPEGSPSARRDPTFFSPSEQRYDESPCEMSLDASPGATKIPRTGIDVFNRPAQSAPAELHRPHKQLSTFTPSILAQPQKSLNVPVRTGPPLLAAAKQQDSFELDRTAPIRALRERSGSGGTLQDPLLDTVAEEDEKHEQPEEAGEVLDMKQKGRAEEVGLPEPEGTAGAAVSRDGTELEPSVGQALLDEWDKLDEPQPASPTADRRQQGRAAPVAIRQAPQEEREDEDGVTDHVWRT